MNIFKTYLTVNSLRVSAMVYKSHSPFTCIFTHGFTTSKQDLTSWLMKCAELKISCCIFDLPNHLLGESTPVSSDIFKEESHLLFHEAEKLFPSTQKFVYGGFSLGSLFAIEASLKKSPAALILAGFGFDDNYKEHIYESQAFSFLLQFRSKLIVNLDSKDLFRWVQKKKETMILQHQEIILISGEDDLVVGKQGMENLSMFLGETNNYTIIKPPYLGHHFPDKISSFLERPLRRVLGF